MMWKAFYSRVFVMLALGGLASCAEKEIRHELQGTDLELNDGTVLGLHEFDLIRDSDEVLELIVGEWYNVSSPEDTITFLDNETVRWWEDDVYYYSIFDDVGEFCPVSSGVNDGIFVINLDAGSPLKGFDMHAPYMDGLSIFSHFKDEFFLLKILQNYGDKRSVLYFLKGRASR